MTLAKSGITYYATNAITDSYDDVMNTAINEWWESRGMPLFRKGSKIIFEKHDETEEDIPYRVFVPTTRLSHAALSELTGNLNVGTRFTIPFTIMDFAYIFDFNRLVEFIDFDTNEVIYRGKIFALEIAPIRKMVDYGAYTYMGIRTIDDVEFNSCEVLGYKYQIDRPILQVTIEVYDASIPEQYELVFQQVGSI